MTRPLRDHLRATLPGAATPSPKKPRAKAKQPEATAQQAFIAWADTSIRRPVRIWFVPNGLGKLGHYMATWGKKMGLRAGVSDVHVSWPGGYGVIEFKSKTGDLTPEQQAFLEDVARCGHRTGIARSMEDAIALLNDWGVPHRDHDRQLLFPSDLRRAG